MQRDVRVLRARLRVPHRTRRDRGIDGRRQVPRTNRALVHAGRDEPLAVGRPPVAAETAHLLGRDELRQAPTHVGLGIGREQGVDARGEVDDVQVTPGDIGHAPAGGIGPRIERGSRAGQLAHVAADEVGQEQPLADDERGDRQRRIRSERDDTGLLLRRRARAGRALAADVRLAGAGRRTRRVRGPRRRRRPIARRRDRRPPPCAGTPPGAVRRHGEGPRQPQVEPAGARELTGERIGHRGTLAPRRGTLRHGGTVLKACHTPSRSWHGHSETQAASTRAGQRQERADLCHRRRSAPTASC